MTGRRTLPPYVSGGKRQPERWGVGVIFCGQGGLRAIFASGLFSQKTAHNFRLGGGNFLYLSVFEEPVPFSGWLFLGRAAGFPGTESACGQRKAMGTAQKALDKYFFRCYRKITTTGCPKRRAEIRMFSVTLEPDLGNASVGSISTASRVDRSTGSRVWNPCRQRQGFFVLPHCRTLSTEVTL